MYKTLSRNLQHGEGRDRKLSSETKAYEKRKNEKIATIGSAHSGKIVRGKITSIVEHGAFVDVNGVGGFVHSSEVSYIKISNIHKELDIGRTYNFEIIEVGLNKNGLLSFKLTMILRKPKINKTIKPDISLFSNNPFSNLNNQIKCNKTLNNNS